MKFLLIDGMGYSGFVSTEKLEKLGDPLFPPLGSLYIGKSLENEGHDVEVLHYFPDGSSVRNIIKSLLSVDAVGISISTSSYRGVSQLAKKIKETDSSIPIIIGGPHCTFHPKRSLNDIPFADISVEGEGEFVIKDIAKSLGDNGKNISDLEGVYYREKDKIKAGRPHKIIRDLDSLPFPARHLVDRYDYGRIYKTYLFKPKITSMVTSRGCPFNCAFCCRNALSYKTYRQRSAENVLEEIIEIDDKYKSVMIVDDNFLVDKKRAHRIMDGLIERGTSIEMLILGARVDSAERELYRKMKKAGVKYMEFGIESGNQDVLDFYNKKITLEQIRKAVNLSREMNFVTAGNFILGAPIETERHFENTIKFACSLPLDIVVFHPLSYLYGSDLWNDAVEKGIINENDEHFLPPDIQRKLSNYSWEELFKYSRRAAKRFYLRPSYMLNQLIMAVARKDFNLIKIGLYNMMG